MKKFILFLLFISSTIMNAGWEKTFGGTENDYGNEIKQTKDGGYIIAGSTQSYGDTNGLDGWLIKLDKSGNKVWDYTFGKPGNKDGFLSVELTEDNGYLVGGFNNFNKMWLLKFNENGSLLWDSVYNSKIAASINSIRKTIDGEFIIGGYGDDNVIKIDRNGNRIWSAKYGKVIKEIEPMQDGSFVIVGENIGIPQEFGYIPSPFVMKINSSGKSIIENPFGKDDLGTFNSLIKTNDSGFIEVGDKITKLEEKLFKRQLIVVKFNNNGKKEWELPGVDNSSGTGIKSRGNDYIITGSYPGTDNYPDNYIAIISNDGNIKWDTSFGGEKYDYPSELLLEEDGDIVTVGQTESSGKGFYDLQVVKIDSSEIPTFVEDYNLQNSKYFVMNYPNPFDNSTTFTVYSDEAEPRNIKIYIYSLVGNLIGSFDGFSGSGGIYNKTFNAEELSPGFYYYKILVNNKELKGKMLVQN